jgi:glycerol-3-phosphate dehydrogenase
VFAKQFEIIDHERSDGVQGRITVVGVKWTTARQVAEQTVNLALTKLDRPDAPCGTTGRPVHGGDLGHLDEFLNGQRPLQPVSLSKESFEHLIETYGTGYHEVLAWCRAQPELLEPVAADRPEILAEIVHGVRAEMAQTLSDVIFRRTGLGTLGWPGRDLLERCARVLAGEFGWDPQATAREINEVETVYERIGVAHGGDAG